MSEPTPETARTQVADALLAARRARRTTPAAAVASLLQWAEDAYAVQDLVAHGLGQGLSRWWKSGGPSRNSTLTHAMLPPSGILQSPADARGLHFNFRKIEAEVALRLGRDVSAEDAKALQPDTARSLVDAMTVSIEIVDSRWTEAGDAPALCKLADLQSHGALVLGEWVPFEARDWAKQHCEVKIGAQHLEFTGTHSLGDPVWLLPIWLRHATRDGSVVEAGTVVTTGTWCGMPLARPGDLVQVRFEGIGSASVQL
ncbi:fumarylacetoacetate hydrolase family protein [Ramlibacter albus]|uniref:Fumarylacetoacetate hydrolase family protein n=1 Tax=Ramlibacter albus TaxID=2079448 RepID=A0A923MFE1_9BURK|nr:fumarylacetoacetate hydrolase family protein [Ramlibacter albus]MBC5768538.1 fumarylacetoacetate hydrolase family protein [Ramlibacter albus]